MKKQKDIVDMAVGDIMFYGQSKYEILDVLPNETFFFRSTTSPKNAPSIGGKTQFKTGGYAIFCPEFAKIEDAVAYLQSKGAIKDGKIIVN